MFSNPVYYPHALNNFNGGQYNPVGGYNNPTGVILPNPNVRGIYIWGFVYECDKTGKLVKPVDFNDVTNINLFIKNGFKLLDSWKFIPFYTGKSQTNLLGRLGDHYQVRINPAAQCYIRLSHAYMTSFFCDPTFPIRYFGAFAPYQAQIAAIIAANPGSIEYLNGPETLPLIYPGIIPVPRPGTTNYPITSQICGGALIHDTLDDLVNQMKNFWFCYLPLPQVSNKLLTEYERFTFWSLKGKTVSQTVHYNPRRWATVTPIANGGQVIFKTDAAGNLVAAPNFPGY